MKNLISKFSTSGDSTETTSTFTFPTKEELRSNPPSTKFSDKVPERKLYLYQGYLERLKSPLILVYQHNNMTVPEYRELQKTVRGLGCNVQTVRGGVMRACLKTTPFEAMLPLFQGPTMIIYTQSTTENLDVPQLAKTVFTTLEKNRKILFLGAKSESLLFSNATFKTFMQLPNLLAMQGQLLGTLQTLPNQFISLLGMEPRVLTQLLAQHKDKLEDK